MTDQIQTAAAVAVPAILALVWLVRLEGRVNLGESRHEDITKALDKIDRKLDRLMGAE